MKEATKSVVLSLLEMSGGFSLARRLTRNRLVALTYHHILPDSLQSVVGRSNNVVYASEFDQHLAYARRHHHVIGEPELKAFIRREAPLPAQSLLITFDDGYRNNYQHAFPILRRHGVTALFFVSSGFVGDRAQRLWLDRFDMAVAANLQAVSAALADQIEEAGGLSALRRSLKRSPVEARENLVRRAENAVGPLRVPQYPAERIEPMTWAEAHEMARAGMQFGSHTETHQVLSGASADEVWNEVTSSRKTIENALGNRCWTFSYPNGERADFRTSDMEMLRRAGYECAFSQVPGLIDSNDDVFALRRVPVPSSPSPLVFQSRATGLHGILTMARRTEST